MTDEARIERLTQLARRVWPSQDATVRWDPMYDVAAVINDRSTILLELQHPRALDMLEAALLVGAGEAPLVAAGQGAMCKLAEPPAWVEKLASEWETTSQEMYAYYERRYTDDSREERLGMADGYSECAEQLRERAKS